MNANPVSIFFYGLFMDAALLASKGVHATEPKVGYAKALLSLATRLGLPDSYLAHIRRAL